jgi:hypothetical protein
MRQVSMADPEATFGKQPFFFFLLFSVVKTASNASFCHPVVSVSLGPAYRAPSPPHERPSLHIVALL